TAGVPPAFSPTRPSPACGGGLYCGRPRSGATSRMARRHNPASSARRWRICRGLRLVDEHDMEPTRPVPAELDAPLDTAGARRAGDQVDGARPGLRRANKIPAILVTRHDLAGAQHDDM